MSDIYKEIELFDCPYCGGPASLEEEHGWSWYVVCLDCGAQTGFCEYKSEEDSDDAARSISAMSHHLFMVKGITYRLSSSRSCDVLSWWDGQFHGHDLRIH